MWDRARRVYTLDHLLKRRRNPYHPQESIVIQMANGVKLLADANGVKLLADANGVKLLAGANGVKLLVHILSMPDYRSYSWYPTIEAFGEDGIGTPYEGCDL
jgi:hypothetical protein